MNIDFTETKIMTQLMYIDFSSKENKIFCLTIN